MKKSPDSDDAPLPGMTKREFMAMQMMQALLSYPTPGRKPLKDLADRSIEATDMLIRRLKETP